MERQKKKKKETDKTSRVGGTKQELKIQKSSISKTLQKTDPQEEIIILKTVRQRLF